jgi:4-hydroxybenzoate polyprenyltransferase
VPTRFGVPRAFAVARACHVATVLFLALAGLGLDVGILYWLGVAAVGALLAYEHSLVSPEDTSRLDTAFFTLNGVISVTFFAFVLADVLA